MKKISKKIDIKTNIEVEFIGKDFIKIKGKKIKYKYLVGADGSNSIVRKYLGLTTNKFLIAIQYIKKEKFKDLELFFNANLFGSSYAWIFPHKNYTSIGSGKDSIIQNFNLKENFEKWLKTKNIDVKKAKFQTFTINFDYQGFKFGNKYLVGDAAGFASGLTGEGIYFAIVSGQEVARKIINPDYDCKNIKC